MKFHKSTSSGRLYIDENEPSFKIWLLEQVNKLKKSNLYKRLKNHENIKGS